MILLHCPKYKRHEFVSFLLFSLFAFSVSILHNMVIRRVSEAVPVNDPIGGSPKQNAYMQGIAEQFTISDEYLQKICDHFIQEMNKGLNNEGHTLAMIPSYVEGRLTGMFVSTDIKHLILIACYR